MPDSDKHRWQHCPGFASIFFKMLGCQRPMRPNKENALGLIVACHLLTKPREKCKEEETTLGSITDTAFKQMHIQSQTLFFLQLVSK